MRWLYGDDVAKELKRVIDRVNDPECRCAMTSGGGYEKAPWDDVDVYLGVEPMMSITPLDGISYPWSRMIWLSPDLYSEGVDAMANTVGHESGHFRFPSWGHFWNEEERFKIPMNHCGIPVGMDGCKCDR